MSDELNVHYHELTPIHCPDCDAPMKVIEVALRADWMICIMGKCTICQKSIGWAKSVRDLMYWCYEQDKNGKKEETPEEKMLREFNELGPDGKVN